MTNQDNPPAVFGEVIHTYTRAQAMADGVLVDVSAMAREAGFRWPVALTRAAWEDCVAWSEDDNRRQAYQDESGRLWDVLWMAANAVRNAPGGDQELLFRLHRIPRDGGTIEPSPVTLKLVSGPGDTGEPVVTLMLPGED